MEADKTRKKESGERITPGALKHLAAPADVNHACMHALHTYNKTEKREREKMGRIKKEREKEKEGREAMCARQRESERANR